ncbi:MAG: hypothetical protein A2X45_03380 [Lentisphaerae bacterium GWF2_50_93]|nr:MAG: hypothetical protein A2X45_03380 [Lentisphaerae bacterium GWF2_50_93]
MPEISTKCSHCNSVFDVEDSYLGSPVECPDCEKEFTIQVQKKNSDNALLLGLYEIKGEPVAGGMGKVFRVHHTTWNVDLAMKQPHPEFFETEEQKQNFIHECDAWINLGLHPHIVSCHYVREINGTPNIFAEWMDGGSLASWIAEGKLDSIEKILDVSIQFAWGLVYAHGKGMIHQDVKPDNVLLTSRGNVKVADFGISNAKAKFSRNAYMKSQIMGTMISESGAYTPAYCSPEQANRGKLTRRTDIWSWAVSVMEMFTGNAIWPSGSVAGKSFEEYLKSPADYFKMPMPDALINLLRECFKENETERPRDFKVIVDKLLDIYRRETGMEYGLIIPKAASDAPDSLNNRALSYMDMAQPEQAERLWAQALKIDPVHLESIYNQGLHLWRSGKIDSIELIRRMETVRHGYTSSWLDEYLLAMIHLDRGDTESAITLLESAASQSNNNPDVVRMIGITANRHSKNRCILTIGCGNQVSSVCFSPDGNRVVSGFSDYKLKLWDLKTGQYLRSFVGHNGPVTSVTFSLDGKFTLSGSDDKTIKLWDVKSNQCLLTFEGHKKTVNSVAFSTDGKFVLSGSDDHSIKLWDSGSGRCLRTFEGHDRSVTSVCFNPDSKTVLSGSGDRSIKLWDSESGRCLGTLEGHKSPVTSVSFDPNGKFALSGSWDHSMKLWDLKSGHCLRTFEGHTSYIRSVGFSPDGKYVLSGSWDNTMKLWDVASNQCFCTFEGHSSNINSICFSPDSKYVLSGSSDNTMKLWDATVHTDWALCRIRSAQETLVHEQRFKLTLQDAVKKIDSGDISAGLSALATARSFPGFERVSQCMELNYKIGQYCRAIGFQAGWLEQTFEGHKKEITSVCFSPNGKFALSGSKDKNIKLWDISGKCLRTFEGHIDCVNSVCYSSDGKLAISGSSDNTLKIWDMESLLCIRTFEGFEGHKRAVNSVSISSNVRFVLSGSDDNTMKLWGISGNTIHTFEGHKSYVNSVCFSPDIRQALSGSSDNTLKLWDIESGKCLHTFTHSDSVYSVVFSPDGKFVLSGSKDKNLKLWSIVSGKCLHTFTHSDSVYSVVFSPDGKFILSESGELEKKDANIRLWDMKSGQCLFIFKGYLSMCFSPDSKSAISGSRDNTMKLWRLDWKYEFPGWADWDEGAEPYLRNFLTLRNGKWNEEDFNRLINDLQNRGYGWLRPEGVKKKLWKMTLWNNDLSFMNKLVKMFNSLIQGN